MLKYIYFHFVYFNDFQFTYRATLTQVKPHVNFVFMKVMPSYKIYHKIIQTKKNSISKIV